MSEPGKNQLEKELRMLISNKPVLRHIIFY